MFNLPDKEVTDVFCHGIFDAVFLQVIVDLFVVDEVDVVVPILGAAVRDVAANRSIPGRMEEIFNVVSTWAGGGDKKIIIFHLDLGMPPFPLSSFVRSSTDAEMMSQRQSTSAR